MTFISLCIHFCWSYGGLKFFLCSDLFLLIIQLGHVRANPTARYFERIMRRIQKSIIGHPIRSIRVFMHVHIFRTVTWYFSYFFLLIFIQIPQNYLLRKEINIDRMRKQRHSNIMCWNCSRSWPNWIWKQRKFISWVRNKSIEIFI